MIGGEFKKKINFQYKLVGLVNGVKVDFCQNVKEKNSSTHITENSETFM